MTPLDYYIKEEMKLKEEANQKQLVETNKESNE